MSDSASLKIERAAEHIEELNVLFREQRPFAYVLEGNAKTGERATYAKKNEAVVQRAALICGDAVHNLRTALDHVYWETVSPHVAAGHTSIQFPFSETAARLDETIKNRLAHKVSDKFFQAIRSLNSHGERGGNEPLYLIHKLDTGDKHNVLIPTADYRRLSSDIIRAQVPDFPGGISNIAVSGSHKDVIWRTQPMFRIARRRANLPTSGIFEQELNVPVDIIFPITAAGDVRPVIPTLYELVGVANATIEIVRDAAS